MVVDPTRRETFQEREERLKKIKLKNQQRKHIATCTKNRQKRKSKNK